MAAGIAVVALVSTPAMGHDLQHRVTTAQAVVIQMHYADGSPFAFEAYEVLKDGDKVPRQVGRTDQAGRIAFLPDGPANWRVRAFSEDGHGLDFHVESGAGESQVAPEQPIFDRFARILAGVGVILGLFGALSLFYRRRRS